MKELKAIIIDDEQHALDILLIQLERVSHSIKVIESFTDPRKALEFNRWSDIDVLFIDIQMPFMNAFAFLEKLGPVSSRIIFTTAFDQYALSALKLGASDYLLKPVELPELNTAINNIVNSKAEEITQVNEVALKRVCVPTTNGFQILELQDIIWMESSNSYTYLFTEAVPKGLLISRTLKSFEVKLESSQFVRVNQSSIINTAYVVSFSRSGGSSVTLKNGKEFTVSPVYRERFLNRFNDMMI